MCRFCELTNGDLGTPLIDKDTKFGKIESNISVWVKNDDEKKKHQLMYNVNFGDINIADGVQNINYCPYCGRQLRVK